MRHNNQSIILDQTGERGGFSLVELFLTLTIIMIMASLTVPIIQDTITFTKVRKSHTEFTNLARAIELYKVGHSHYPQLAKLDAGVRQELNVDLQASDLFELLQGNGLRQVLREPQNRSVSSTLKEIRQNEAETYTDALGDARVFLIVDHDGDGLIPLAELPEYLHEQAEEGGYRAHVLIFTDKQGYNEKFNISAIAR